MVPFLFHVYRNQEWVKEKKCYKDKGLESAELNLKSLDSQVLSLTAYAVFIPF